MRDFDELYAQYFAQVYKFSLSLCRDPVLAEEITQETFFKCLKNIDRFQGDCKLSSWLCQIAKNTFYSHARRQGWQTGEPFPQLLPSEETLEQRFDDKETALEIHRTLHRLKEPYKEVFWLRAFGELSFAQIGVIFGKTEGWARTAYYRAKIQIKEELP